MPKHYEHEYKEYVCRLVVEENKKVTELSRDLGIPVGTIKNWLAKYKDKEKWDKVRRKKHKDGEQTVFHTPTDYEEALKQRKKEIEILKEENEILKKAMHVFTKNQE
ncbi:transposase [Alkalibacterium sp. 20]|uniref:transposase n=1 Tax=Alkalibacterium sp. 20 TaxID=1798803 RepID=UPI0008FFF6BF|nr:transposase [Alkalibacterium sp. 20]OJF93834.1 hypothetical protein AX762_08605 [Alkalibacterium sp. 20]